MHILLDMDGVICDLIGGLNKRFGITDPYLDPSNFGKYEWGEIVGINPWADLDESFWENLPETAEFSAIMELVAGHDVTICTRSIGHLSCKFGKLRWLERRGLLENVIFTRNKWRFDSNGSVLIDDHDEQIDSFLGYTVAVPRPWNRHHHLIGPTGREVMKSVEDQFNCILR